MTAQTAPYAPINSLNQRNRTMTQDNDSNDERAEHIRRELSDGPAEQDWLVETLTERYGHGRQDVLGTIRTLMRRGEVSYDLRWRLQYEGEDV